MKHNVGDRVRVHTLEWFEKNCVKDSTSGDFCIDRYKTYFIKPMRNLCGKVVIIESQHEEGSCYYRIVGNKYYWYDWMFEEDDVKEETNWEHYQQEIGEFIKTKECENCPAYKICNPCGENTCGLIFANWAMSKYVPEIPKPVYRAWTKDTFPLHVGAEIRNRDGKSIFGIVGYDKDREVVEAAIFFYPTGAHNIIVSFSDLYVSFVQADGTPCGELVSGEETK